MPIPITFHIYEGDQLVRTETFAQDVIKIGKLDSSHLRIDDAAVSRMHSVIEVSGPGEVYIIDLGSASGTIVNGQRVNKARLESGDQLQFGSTVVVVEVGAEVEDQAAPPFAAHAARRPSQQAPCVAAARSRAAPMPRSAARSARRSRRRLRSRNTRSRRHLRSRSTRSRSTRSRSTRRPQYRSRHGGEYGALAHEAARDYGEPVTYQLVPTAPPVNPADVDSAETAVEVIVMWGELSILHVEHLSPPRSFYVGEATDAKGKPTTDFLIGSESHRHRAPAGRDRVGLERRGRDPARRDRRRHDQQPEHHVRGAGGAGSAAGAARSSPARAQYPLPPGATARVQYRGFTFIVKPMSAARRVGVGGSPALDLQGVHLDRRLDGVPHRPAAAVLLPAAAFFVAVARPAQRRLAPREVPDRAARDRRGGDARWLDENKRRTTRAARASVTKTKKARWGRRTRRRPKISLVSKVLKTTKIPTWRARRPRRWRRTPASSAS